MNSGQEIPSELVISCSDAAEVLEPAKAALDDISAFVGAFVEAMDDDTVGFVGNDASLIQADANKQRSIAGQDWRRDRDPARSSRAVKEYLATLDHTA
jgi:hypothetical protein